MRPRASHVAKTEDAPLTVQTSIRAPRRLVVPKQASTRMDTLGEDTNAS